MLNQTVDTSGLTNGINRLAAGIGSAANSVTDMSAFQQQQDDAVDIARAEAFKTKGLLDMQEAFKTDPHYETFKPRAEQQTQDLFAKASDLIRDPLMKEKWQASSEDDRARAVAGVVDQADTMRTSSERAAYLTSMDDFQKVATDPTTPEDTRRNAQVSIAAMIHTGLGNRMLSPEDGYKLKKTYLDGTDEQLAINRAGVDIENDPGAVMHNLGIPVTPAGNELAQAQIDANPGGLQLDYGLAKMVAGDLHDANFPQEAANAKAYLSDPEVNARYAAQATTMLTQRYKGDMTAAVIAAAPDGGTKLADKWVASNHDENVLPPKVRDYYRGVMTKFTPQAGAATLPIVANGVDLSTIDAPVLDRFEKLQAVFGKQLPVVQGDVPTAAPDQHIGGALPSGPEAERGLSVDVSALSPDDRKRLLVTASAMGFGGIGIGKNQMHLDAGDPRVWGPTGTADSVPAAMQPEADQHVTTGHIDIPANYAPVDPRYAAMSFDQRLQVYNKAKQALDQKAVSNRSSLEYASQNAPSAISDNGVYTGYSPTANDFVAAYGGAEGVQRWSAYNASIDTAHSMFAMKTMPGDQIATMVRNAMPTNTGDQAYVQSKEFDTLSQASTAVLKARETDPAKAVMSAFPDVARAWQGVGDDPTTVSNAILMTDQAEQKLGITNRQLLPVDFAHNIAATFNNQQLPVESRIGSITSTVLLAKTPAQQQAVFAQLVKEGVPQYAQGAMAAMERGDQQGAQALFRATMVDPDKLPGKPAHTQDEIKQAVQQRLFDNNGIASLSYGLSDGSAKNYDRAAQDGTLLVRDVTLRLMDGSAGGNLDTAVDLAKNDLFGKNIKAAVGSGQGAGFRVTVDQSVDQQQLASGFTGLLGKVQAAIVASTDPLVRMGDVATGSRAVTLAVRDNYVRNALAEGYFANYGEGNFTFVEPRTGQAIPGADGKPLTFTLDDVRASAASNALPAVDPRMGLGPFK